MLVRNIQNCENLKTIKYENGNIYQGTIMKNLENQIVKNGYGKLFTDKIKYHGEFKNDMREGKGKEYTDTYIYNGTFKNDRFHGKGIYENLQEQTIFTGSFFNGLRHGDGSEFQKKQNKIYDVSYNMGISNSIIPFNVTYDDNKQKIEAFKHKDKTIGPFKLYYNNGTLAYKGSYDDGLQKGILNTKWCIFNGTFNKTTLKDSKYQFDGEYKFTGHAKMKYYYCQQFLSPYSNLFRNISDNDEFEIDGVFTITLQLEHQDNNDQLLVHSTLAFCKVDINFTNDKTNISIKYENMEPTKKEIDIDYSFLCCNKPTIYKLSIRNKIITGSYKHNLVYRGQFNNTMKYNGDGILYKILENGNELLIYEGKFINNNYEGYGTQYIDGHKQYEGYWLNNYHSGQGIEYYPNDQVKYEGYFQDHIPAGEGILYDNVGNIIFSGLFEDGAPRLV